MSVVVTGGAGFIGANLCRRLTADGNIVLALDDLSSGARDFRFVDSVTGLIADADAVARRVVATEPVNIAFGTRTGILTPARMIEEIVGTPLTIEHVEPRVGDVRDSEGDATRLRQRGSVPERESS